jgi:hypothetical protein
LLLLARTTPPLLIGLTPRHLRADSAPWLEHWATRRHDVGVRFMKRVTLIRARHPLIERLYSETLLAVEGQPTAARDLMLVRTAILFELLSDRRCWPDHIRGL